LGGKERKERKKGKQEHAEPFGDLHLKVEGEAGRQ